MNYFIRRETGFSTYSINEFEWTTDVPKETGWYWVTNDRADESVIVEVDDMDGELMVVEDDGGAVGLDYWKYWIGPLPKPSSRDTSSAH